MPENDTVPSRRIVKRAAALLGVSNGQSLHMIEWNRFDQTNLRGRFRDRILHIESTVPDVPIRLNARRHVEGFLPSRGLNVFQSRAYADIQYVVYNPENTGEGTYYFIRKGELFRLIRGSRRMIRKHLDWQCLAPILDATLLENLQEDTVGFLQRSRGMRRFGVRTSRGILLNGTPGNGKTMACRWVQALCAARGYAVNIVTNSELQEAYSEDTMSEVVSGSAVTFFDDIDIAYLDRRAGDGRMACSLLAAMDGIEIHGPRVWVFTTNEDPRNLDAAFLRPGRIDRQYTFSNPTELERRRLIDERWPAEVRHQIDVGELVEKTEGFSFAELEFVRSQLVIQLILDSPLQRKADPVQSTLEEVRFRNPALARRRAPALGFS